MSDGAEAVSSNLRLRTLFTPPPCAVRQMTLGTRSSIQTRSDLTTTFRSVLPVDRVTLPAYDHEPCP